MGRLPFDPKKMASTRKAGNAPLSVSVLAGRIDGALRQSFPKSVRVVGEISGLRDRTHWYFDLKDEQAVVHCVMFASARKRVGFAAKDGQEVVLTGRVEFYAPSGRVSLVVSRMEPVGVGRLELAYRALCDELRGLGWFEPTRKRPLPTMPRRIAIVTSRSAAALADVVDTAQRRFPGVELCLVDVRVQGDSAAGEIARALVALSDQAEDLGIDAIILTRGGGSMEDLWAFNDRQVAQAIVDCSIPVVAAIGHETDTTIAELVADVRAATPTQAAMRLIPDRDALREQVTSLAQRLESLAERHLSANRDRLESLARHPYLTDPGAVVKRGRDRLAGLTRMLRAVEEAQCRSSAYRLEQVARRLDAVGPVKLHARRVTILAVLTQRLGHAVGERLSVDCDDLAHGLDRAWRVARREQRIRLNGLERTLEAVGPRAVLERGYSVTRTADGRVVRARDEVRPGQTLTTILAHGQVRSVVQPDGEAKRSGRPQPSVPTPAGKDQLDLFASGG